MRNFIYTLNRLIVGVIGFLILFLGELMTKSVAWSILTFICAVFCYWALQFLSKKEKYRYNTPKYRTAMKKSYERGAEMFCER